MSAALDRIIAAVRTHSIVPPTIELHDADSDGSVSIGQWKDAINVELKAVKSHLLRCAKAYRASGDDGIAEDFERCAEDL